VSFEIAQFRGQTWPKATFHHSLGHRWPSAKTPPLGKCASSEVLSHAKTSRREESTARRIVLRSQTLKPRRTGKVSRFGFGKFQKPSAQQKSRQEMTYLPAADLISEFTASRRAGSCECSAVGWQRVHRDGRLHHLRVRHLLLRVW
jgi:hypothetical protein